MEDLIMPSLTEQLQNLNTLFPKQEFQPSAFGTGVVEQLKEIAGRIESGELVITHFSLTMESDSNKQRLELEVA